ncbi:MAG: hypothetical protein JWL71_4977 [Acidobacteria bacterium]|nr:hypothetical protein [Acidobacteriota bacterium]
MRARELFGAALLATAVGSATVTAGDGDRRPPHQWAMVYLAAPTLIGSTIVQGPVLFMHDAEKMARGEPCTSVRLVEPATGPLEDIAAFHCLVRPGGTAPNHFVLTIVPNVIAGFGGVLTAYQFAGDSEIHGVPVLAAAH